MGFFKSMSDLNKQAKQIEKTFDPGQQMKDGMAKMAEANAMMAAQTQAANLALTGTPATATIVSAQQTGALINFQPSLQLDLLVLPTGGVPYPVTVTQVVEQPFLGKAIAGSNVSVKVDSADPQVVWIDWIGS
jgi:hypothetical protein